MAAPCKVVTVQHPVGSKEWKRKRDAAFKREWRKTLPADLTPDEVKKLEEITPKLIRYLEVGALDDKNFAQLVTEAWGEGIADPKVLKRLTDLAEEAEAKPEGIARDRIYAQMNRILEDEAGFSVIDAIQRGDWWFASVLMRMGTFANVISGSFLTSAAFEIAKTLDAAVIRGRPLVALRQLGLFISGATDAALSAKDIIGSGKYELLLDAKQRNLDILNGKKGPDVLEALLRKGNAAGVLAYTRRIMSYLDYLFAQGQRDSSMLYAALTRNDQAAMDRIMQRFDTATANAALKRASDDLGPTATPSELRKRQREILDEDIAIGIKETAVQIARRSAQNADPVGIMGAIYDFSKGIPWFIKAPLGLSFLRAAFNTIRTAGDFIPGVGLATLYRSSDDFKQRFKGSPLERFATLDLSPEERRLAAYSQVLGGGLLFSLMGWAFSGDTDDDGLEISGPWKNVTPQQAKELRALGQQPYAIKLPGSKTWWSYKQAPVAPILASIGAVRDNRRFDKDKWDEKSTVNKLYYSYMTGMQYTKDIASLGQFAYAMGISANNKEEPSADKLNEWLSRSVGRTAGGMVPSVLNEIQQILDPTMRAPSKDETLGYWWKNFPVASLANRPVLNFFGEPVEATKPPLRALATIEKTEPLYQFVGKWAGEGLFVPQAGATAQVVDPKTFKKRKMTDAELYEYQQVFGQTFKRLIEPFVKSMGDRATREMVAAAYDKVGDAAAKSARARVQSTINGNANTLP